MILFLVKLNLENVVCPGVVPTPTPSPEPVPPTPTPVSPPTPTPVTPPTPSTPTPPTPGVVITPGNFSALCQERLFAFPGFVTDLGGDLAMLARQCPLQIDPLTRECCEFLLEVLEEF